MSFFHGHDRHQPRRRFLRKGFEFWGAFAAASSASRDTSAKALQRLSAERCRPVGAQRRPTIRYELTPRLMRPKISGK